MARHGLPAFKMSLPSGTPLVKLKEPTWTLTKVGDEIKVSITNRENEKKFVTPSLREILCLGAHPFLHPNLLDIAHPELWCLRLDQLDAIIMSSS